jgi:hypothetical protein
MKRTIVTLHLPLEMGSVGRILQVVGSFYQDATIAPGDDSASLEVWADPDAILPPGFYDGPGSACATCGYGAGVHVCPSVPLADLGDPR